MAGDVSSPASGPESVEAVNGSWDPPQASLAAAGASRPEGATLLVPDHELLRCIGRGAYGAVWMARNVMGNYRAVKILRREEFARDRPFQREYEGLLKFEPISRSHPNLMQILHVGRRDGYFYYVTELADNARNGGPEAADSGTNPDAEDRPVQGEGQNRGTRGLASPSPEEPTAYVPRTLQAELESRKRLPTRECVSLAIALASALKHLHEHGLVHRDVKPSNVIFVHGVPKLADIGLVATVGDSRSIVGTEGYLPPEGPGNPQADLYALGKLLYEVSTSMDRSAFPQLPKNLGELPDAAELLEFNEVLLKACTKDTARRYQHANEMLADLALLERGDSVKRLRRLERHHVLYKRIGAGVLAAGLLVSLACWQSWRMHRVAGRHLAQLHENEGTRRMLEGDYATALPWFVGALALDRGDAAREQVHRMQIANVLRRCPMPVAHYANPKSKTVALGLNRDGTLLATAHGDGSVWLWDLGSGQKVLRLVHDYPVVFCEFLGNRNAMITVTAGQQLHVWDLAKPARPVATFEQAVDIGSDLYSVGMNATLGTVYLSKGRYCFARTEKLAHPFENLTLSLKLAGRGDNLLVSYQVRRTGSTNDVLYQGELLDTPQAEVFKEGRDEPALPIWGGTLLALESSSTGDKPGDRGQVVWGTVRSRCYPSGAPPGAWRVVEDFRHWPLTNWLRLVPLDSQSTCKAEDGRLVLILENLPLSQLGWVGMYRRERFDITPDHTLEVQADLVSAQAPHAMAGLTLCKPQVTPFTAPERPFIVRDRWLILSHWERAMRVWDLETGGFVSTETAGEAAPVELAHPRNIRQGDASADGRYLAVADTLEGEESSKRFAIWELRTGRKVKAAIPENLMVSGVRFSPDNRFLALSHREGIELVRASDWQVARRLDQGAFAQPSFSPRGFRFAAVRDGREIMVWELDSPAKAVATLMHDADIRRIGFNPDGRYLVSTTVNGIVRMWDVLRAEAFGPPLPGSHARFSPDGTKLLVFGDDGGVWEWDVSRVEDDTISVPALRVEQPTAFSRDGTMTAEIGGQGMGLNTPAGRYSLALPGPVLLQRVAFSSDDRFLVAEGSDLRLWAWDPQSRALLGPPRPIRYDAQLQKHPPLPLVSDNHNRAMLFDLAALLGEQRPDGQGGMISISVEHRVRLIGQLARKDRRDEAECRVRWHQEQAAAAELAMDWEAAVFHWECVIAAEKDRRGPSTRSSHTVVPAESRLAYARGAAEIAKAAVLDGRDHRSVILPRQPWASPATLDLGRFYTTPLREELGTESSVPFCDLGSGMQILGEMPFDVRGIIDLKRANAVVIPVGRPCRRLHFLNAANQAPFHREPVGTYTVTYANRLSAGVTLQNPEHVPPFTRVPFHEVSALSRTNTSLGVTATLVWSGAMPVSRRHVEPAYLTLTTWELPDGSQNEVVESIKLQAGPSRSAPLILAITVE